MRRLLIVVVITAGIGVGAGPRAAAAQGWSEPDPAALIGRWTGTATWRSCAVTGAAKVGLDVARDGSGYRIDLAPLLEGLGGESFAPVGGPVIEAGRADLHATWTQGKLDRAVLRLTLGPVCQATVTLRRTSVGAAACDELLGLRAVAAACPLLDPRPVADPDADATLATLRPGRRLAARPRALAEVACRREARPLRDALITVGCAPAPIDPEAGPPIAQCDALIETVIFATRCNRVPVEMKQRLTEQIRIVARSAAVSDPGARASLLESCTVTRTEVMDTLALVGCK